MRSKMIVGFALMVFGCWWASQKFQDAEPSQVIIFGDRDIEIPLPEQVLQEPKEAMGSPRASATDSQPASSKKALDKILNPLPQDNKPSFSMIPNQSEDSYAKPKKRTRWILDADRISLWKMEGKLTVYSREENLNLPPKEEEPDHLPQSLIADALAQKRSISSEESH